MKKKLIFLITYIILTGCIAKSGAKLYEETPKPEVSAVTEKTPEATDGAVDDLLVEADEAAAAVEAVDAASVEAGSAGSVMGSSIGA